MHVVFELVYKSVMVSQAAYSSYPVSAINTATPRKGMASAGIAATLLASHSLGPAGQAGAKFSGGRFALGLNSCLLLDELILTG